MKTDLNLEENLSRLKGSYNQGKMSEAVYESKQKEIIGSMLKECFDKGLISKAVFESMQKKLPDNIPAK
ncbi:hypothetical protein [Desulfobacterium sp. N47]|uniref:Uncharacterized protein n=1 Tax=uncultured Desulfobacterium sp. TaxID=201089 RepID=E1YAK1_9BACT|nr:unknown protein [uncultured Desulfobacterium sp.]